MLLHRFAAVWALCCLYGSLLAQTPQDSLSGKTPVPAAQNHASKWYDKITIKGYAQFRYNRLLESNPDLNCEQCDKSWGKNQGFAFRRGRLILSGNVHTRLFVYLQFDYSSDASGTSKHFLQVRDAYFDYAFDAKKEYRIRFGQSKVPYGFDNLQSSSNRLPLDRSDAINSGVPNEREMGTFFYYAPTPVRERFKELVENGLKGSGDYGIFGIGLYNGQSTNKPEQNDWLHAVARLSYPIKMGRQMIEPGIQAYTGTFTMTKDQISTGLKVNKDLAYTDQRAAVSLVLYPQPFGIQAEYNVGKSPAFDAAIDSVRVQNLSGGYVTASYRTKIKGTFVQPYVRYQSYDGAKKHETDARMYHVRETEVGVEWQLIKNLELTLAYVASHRRYEDLKTDYDEKGHLLRVQLQANY